ncbi:hypothetical protein CZ794_10240 [Psychrobacter sp. JB385]|nr:hypothetical protein CZ794_10240 [Psychrobacter sp. JB385]
MPFILFSDFAPNRLAPTVYQIIIIGTTSVLLSAIDLSMTIFAHQQ